MRCILDKLYVDKLLTYDVPKKIFLAHYCLQAVYVRMQFCGLSHYDMPTYATDIGLGTIVEPTLQRPDPQMIQNVRV